MPRYINVCQVECQIECQLKCQIRFQEKTENMLESRAVCFGNCYFLFCFFSWVFVSLLLCFSAFPRYFLLLVSKYSVFLLNCLCFSAFPCLFASPLLLGLSFFPASLLLCFSTSVLFCFSVLPFFLLKNKHKQSSRPII